MGKKLRNFRIARGFTLQDVASSVSLSKAYVSQLENDKANPSLATLKSIVDFYKVPLAALFDGSQAEAMVVRRKERRTFSLPGCDVKFELLSPDTERELDFVLTVAEPGVGTGPSRFVHEAEECGLVYRGKLKVFVGQETYILEEGDSIFFPSNVPHGWENVGDTSAEAIWVYSRPSF